MNNVGEDEIAKMISKMTISQLQDYTTKLQNEEINIGQNIYKLINSNLSRFDSLQQPQVQLQDTINEYIEQLQSSINIREITNRKLTDISQQLNAAKQKIIAEKDTRTSLEPYIQYRQLAQNLQKYQNNIEIQLQVLSRVLPVYDHIATNGLNDSLELFYNTNSEQIFQFFTDMIQKYQENDFDDKYFDVLIQLGIPEIQILKIAAGILDQQLKNYDIKKFIAIINTLYSQFQSVKPYSNNKVLPEIINLLNKQLQAEKEQLPSYVQQIYQIFNMPDQQVSRESKYQSIFLPIQKKINAYTDGITTNDELEVENDEIYNILKQKSFIYVSFQLEQFIEQQVHTLIQQLSQEKSLDSRIAHIYKEISFSQDDIAKIQKIKAQIGKQLQFYYNQFPDEVKPDSQQITDFIILQIQLQILRCLKNLQQNDLFKKLYTAILGAHIWEQNWQSSIVTIIKQEFERLNKHLYDIKISSIKTFVEICKYVAHTAIQITDVLRHKETNGNPDQIITKQIQNYLREENEVNVKNFIQHNRSRKDMKIISQFISEFAQEPQSPVVFSKDQFGCDDVNQLKNIRRPIYYAITQTVSSIMLNQQQLFQQFFNNNNVIQILMALLSVIFVISSIINESESEVIGYTIEQLMLDMQYAPVSIDELNQRFHEAYN